MKKFLLVIIALALLMSGCNNSELDNRSSSIPPSNESVTQTNGQSSTEITIREPASEANAEFQHTSTNEPIASDNTSFDTPSSTTVQSSSTFISSSTGLTSSASSSNSVSSTSSSSKPAASSSFENTVSTSESNPESTISTTSTVSSSSTIKLPESSSVVSSNNNPEPPSNKEENTLNISITVNGRIFSATLQDNETAREFKSRLPLTLDMSELNGNEKYYYLPDSLPTDSSRPSRINSGDIMLYGNSCLVIFYESFSTSYSYTRIGKIDDPDGLAAALGSGGVQVTFN